MTKPCHMGIVVMDVEDRVASRQRSAFCWPPFCFREEKACVEWGPLLGSLICLPRLFHLSPIPFGSWRLLDSLVRGQQSYTSEHTVTTQQTTSACSSTSKSVPTLKVGSDLTYARWRDSRGLQSSEGQSPSWLEYGKCLHVLGKRGVCCS